jgi:hypothetical protein
MAPNVTDLVGGTRSRTIKNPDGTQEIIIEPLEMSPEDKALYEQYQTLLTSNLTGFSSLATAASAYDLPAFKPVIDAYRTQLQTTRDKASSEAVRRSEEQLARRGMTDSTAATELRAVQDAALREQSLSDERNLIITAEALRTDALNRALTGINIGTQGLDTKKAQQQASGQFASGTALQALNSSANIQNQNYQNQLQAFNSRQPSFGQQLLTTAAAAAGYGLTGGFGNPSGLLGGLFGGAAKEAAPTIGGDPFGYGNAFTSAAGKILKTN